MIPTPESSSNDIYFYIELIIVAFFIIFQLAHTFSLYRKIKKLKIIFKDRFTIKNGFIEKSKIGMAEDILSMVQYDDNENESYVAITDDDIIKITLVDTEVNNEVIQRIKHTLNSYLINNYGAAVNFSIIKDIIDREVDVSDEEISQSIPTPLYIGLAATMIGIILGLFAMPKLNGDGFIGGINALIDGVKLAMTASLIGLLCTTWLSSVVYKKAKRVVLRDKNDRLSFLQARLLPELVRAEDTGVSGLKASLDRFAREATKISDNVKIAANRTGMNLQAQLDLITKVENMNMTRVSKINLELFDRLESNMVSFNQFSTYLTLMNNISENLYKFSSSTENVEVISKEIKSTLKDSKELSQFLTLHFQQIQSAGGSALNAVNLSDSHFRESIERLSIETSARISKLNSLSDNAESTIKQTFDNIGIRLNEITEKHLNSLTAAYNASIPHFEQLDHLNVLPELSNKSTNQSKELIVAINQLNSSLHTINHRIDNHSVLTKLDSIEKSLNRKIPVPKDPVPNEPVIKVPGVKDADVIPPKNSIFKKLRNMFSGKTKKVKNEEQ